MCGQQIHSLLYSKNIRVVGYADDIFLLSPSLDGLQRMLQISETEHDLQSGNGYFSPMLLKTCSYFTLPSFVPFNSIWYMLNAHSQKCNEKEVGCKENVSFSDEFSDFSPYRIHRI